LVVQQSDNLGNKKEHRYEIPILGGGKNHHILVEGRKVNMGAKGDQLDSKKHRKSHRERTNNSKLTVKLGKKIFGQEKEEKRT